MLNLVDEGLIAKRSAMLEEEKEALSSGAASSLTEQVLFEGSDNFTLFS